MLYRNIKRQCTVKPLRVEIKYAKKRGIDEKGIREGSIPPSSSNVYPLHKLFLGKPALSQWLHLPPHKVFNYVSFDSFFDCPMEIWLSMLPYQRLAVFLLRNHKLQDSRWFLSSLFLLASPKSVLDLPINPGIIQKGADGSFGDTSEASVLDVKRLKKNFLFWVLWNW